MSKHLRGRRADIETLLAQSSSLEAQLRSMSARLERFTDELLLATSGGDLHGGQPSEQGT